MRRSEHRCVYNFEIVDVDEVLEYWGVLLLVRRVPHLEDAADNVAGLHAVVQPTQLRVSLVLFVGRAEGFVRNLTLEQLTLLLLLRRLLPDVTVYIGLHFFAQHVNHESANLVGKLRIYIARVRLVVHEHGLHALPQVAVGLHYQILVERYLLHGVER